MAEFKEIEAPDGSVIEFPADMPDAQIEAVMRQQFPPPATMPAATQQQGGIGAFNEGILNELLAAQQGTSPVTQTLTGEQTYQPVGELLTMETEMGPANTVIQRGPDEFVNLDPSRHAIFSQGGKIMAFERNPEMDEGQLLRAARILGIGTLAPARGSAAAARQPLTSQMQQNVRAMEQAGVTPTVPLTTQGAAPRMLTQSVGGVPMAGGPITRGIERTEGEMLDALEDVMGQFGTARGSQEGGETVILGAEEWLERWRQVGTRADEALRARFGDTPIELRKFETALSEPFVKWDNERLAEMFPKEWLENWRRTVQESGGSVSYNDLINLRQEIGSELSRPVILADKDRGQLERLYGAISNDLLRTAEDISPGLANHVRRRNNYWKTGYDRVRNALKTPLTPNVNPESVFERVMAISRERGRTANIQELRELRKTLGNDRWNDLSAAVMSRMMRTTPGRQATQGPASVTTFLTNYNAMSDRAKSLLFSGREQAQRNLDNLVENVLPRLEQLNKYENVSRTGNVQGITALGAIWALGDLTSALTTAAGANLTARALMNPRFTRWLSRVATAADNAVKSGKEFAAPGFWARFLPQLRVIVRQQPELQPALPAIEALAEPNTEQE